MANPALQSEPIFSAKVENLIKLEHYKFIPCNGENYIARIYENSIQYYLLDENFNLTGNSPPVLCQDKTFLITKHLRKKLGVKFRKITK